MNITRFWPFFLFFIYTAYMFFQSTSSFSYSNDFRFWNDLDNCYSEYELSIEIHWFSIQINKFEFNIEFHHSPYIFFACYDVSPKSVGFRMRIYLRMHLTRDRILAASISFAKSNKAEHLIRGTICFHFCIFQFITLVVFGCDDCIVWRYKMSSWFQQYTAP